jgi:Tfp pilus assembly protein PilO
MNTNASPKLFMTLTVLALCGGLGLMYMQSGKLSAKRIAVEEAQTNVHATNGARKELELSKQRLSELRLKLSHLEKSVADFQYVPTMLAELERYGHSTGIDVSGIRPVAATRPTNPEETTFRKAYDQITIDVTGRGTYSQIQSFLGGLDRFPKIVAVRTMSLTPKTGTDLQQMSSPPLEVKLELQVFVFPQVGSTTPATDAAIAATVSEVNQNG